VLTFDAALDSRLELIISPRLRQEIAVVLARPRLRKYPSSEDALRFVADLVAQTMLMADPPGPPPAMCRDPDEEYLVALATASGAGALVTVDLDLLAVDRRQLSFEVITPAVACRSTRLTWPPASVPGIQAKAEVSRRQPGGDPCEPSRFGTRTGERNASTPRPVDP
jgi:putative PIN family toxin of toxin-antitoxin system